MIKMKIYLIFCLPVCASALHEEVLKAQWESYKAQYGKEYHPSVEAHHFKNFLQSTITIEEHNERYHRGEVGYKLGHNQFSDLSHEDVKRKLLGKKKINIEGYYNFTEMPPMDSNQLPKEIDWRQKVTDVKYQGDCGSCYAFAALAVVESAILRKKFIRLDLSEQQIVDCSYHFEADLNDGCEGGDEFTTLTYISLYGVNTELDYQYVSGVSTVRDTCRKKEGSGDWGKGLEIHRIPKDDEKELAYYVVNYGPLLVSFSIENEHIQKYSGGIYDNESCSKEVEHTALLVGYGTENHRRYWLIKNSFGEDWGENGYIRLLRGVNQCGIVTDFSYFVEV